MKLVAGKEWIDLAPHLDIEGLYSMHEEINIAIASNYMHIRDCFGQKQTLYNIDTLPTVEDEQLRLTTHNISFSNKSAETIYLKLRGVQRLGSQLVLRQGVSFLKKHISENATPTPASNSFKFLFDWIDQQNCFSSYGRVVFFFTETHSKGAIHKDYPSRMDQFDFKDMYLWVSGPIKKDIFLYDPIASEKHYMDSPSVLFNNYNYHGTENPNARPVWSLRIDGIFTKEFAQRIGAYEYFKEEIDTNTGP